MTQAMRIPLLIVCLLAMAATLTGCPPAGAGRQGQQNMPAGMLPPPGLESGGARTLMGTTIVAPDDSYLLVKFARRGETAGPSPSEPKWRSCRRVIPMDNFLIIEGLNYDGRDEKADKDVNELVPTRDLEYFYWKYEAKPAPPASATPGREQKGRKK